VTLLRHTIAPPLVVIAFAVFMHAVVGALAPPFYAKMLMDIGINVILAVSLNFVNGFTGQFSLGHAAFLTVGGYAAGITTYYAGFAAFGTTAPYGGSFGAGGALFFVGTVIAGVVAAAFGFLVGLPSLRLRGDYLAIVTLGFGEILRVVVQRTGDVEFDPKVLADVPWWQNAVNVGGALGFTGLPFYTNLFWVWLWVGVTLLVAFRLKESTQGRGFLAIREDEIAAESMGVPTTTLKVRAFVLAAFFAGIAGALFAHEAGTTLNPKELGFQKSFEIVIMVVLGGMGSVSGTVLAAIVLTLLPELLREFSEYRMIAYALVLIAAMLVRPQGLFGLREIWDRR
jgi:branched-chain amino acid transport system permease protein